MASIKDVTLDMPISFSNDRRKRRSVRSSKTPIHATGVSIDSIKLRKVNRNEFTIEPTTRKAQEIFSENENPGGNKVARKAFGTGDKIAKEVEDAIYKDLERMLK